MPFDSPTIRIMVQKVVIIDGIIGAGKSTLLHMLAAELRSRGARVAVAPEPVDAWRASGALAQFYSDPARYASEFQMYVYATRVLSVCAACAAVPDADYVLLERSVLTDSEVFFRTTNVSETSARMYAEWCGVYVRLLPVSLDTAAFVYLRPSLDACMTRVHERGRTEEVGRASTSTGESASNAVSRDYQARLLEAYDSMMQRMTDADRRVIRVDTDADFRHDVAWVAALADRLP